MTASKARFSGFLHDERGGISNLILPMFLLMMVTSGMAIDLVDQETQRADEWNAADRGMLAAASLLQRGDPEMVIRDYLAKRPYAGFADSCDEPKIDSTVKNNFREFSIEYNCTMNTAFARLAGQPQFQIPVVSGAVEGVDAIEISLILDISGSMAASTAKNTTDKRLTVLREAAKAFVTEVMSGPNANSISISLVPYSGQVNAGPFFDAMITPGGRYHTKSSCIEFEDADFTSTALPTAKRGQTPVFQWFIYEGDSADGGRGYEADWGWCPSDAQGILPFTNDKAELFAKIDAFRAHDGTGTQYGMKWGVALLDPTTQPIVANLSANGQVYSGFANRPGAFGKTEIQKIIVLMTDGNIRYQNRPRPDVVANANVTTTTVEQNGQSTVVDDPVPGERAYWEEPRTFVYRGRTYLRNVMHTRWTSQGINNPAYTVQPDFGILSNTDEPLRTSQFLEMCKLAQQKGIRIFTVGFDISTTSDAYSEMEACATSTADFFFVEGLDLVTAFEQIAVLTQRLRLTR